MVEETITIDGEEVVVTLDNGEAWAEVYDKETEIEEGMKNAFGSHRFKGVYPSTGVQNVEHSHFAVVGTSVSVDDISELSDVASGVLYVTSGSRMGRYDHGDKASAEDVVFFF